MMYRYTIQGWGQVHRYLYLTVHKYIFSRTCMYFVLEFQNVLVLVPKYITKYLVLEDKYIASTSHFVPKNIYYNLLFQLFSAIFAPISN